MIDFFSWEDTSYILDFDEGIGAGMLLDREGNSRVFMLSVESEGEEERVHVDFPYKSVSIGLERSLEDRIAEVRSENI